ncbi:ATP-binding cassette domain-containing protein [Candidatus Saccharibacteria bacterium]|nr:ATP-binding cassette domain-containing protein [Candidatus Saccharibacteria bacterium]
MLISVDVPEKSFGDKVLYRDLSFEIQEAEKVGLIGRNGSGKSTLLHLMTGEDKDFEGEISVKRGTVVVSSRQEHHGHEAKTVLEYIQGDLPEYASLTHIIDTYPNTMGNDSRKLQQFSDALERFGQLGYYQIEEEIEQAFESYQIDPKKMHLPMGELSGGQQRMVELIKVQRSRGHIALIDEPTNHMDYIAKASFIKWLKSTAEAVLVITHDRDVLSTVDRILEIRDGRSYSFRGNYDAYLKNNTNQITNQVNEYELSQRRIVNLQEDVIRFRRLKEKSRTPGTIKRFKSQELRAMAQIKVLQETEKPSFWIDQESASGMNDKLTAAYDRHKTKNIKVGAKQKDLNANGRLLLQASSVSFGYGEKPLFTDVSFIVREGERLRLHGRNGAGKSTLVQAIMAETSGRSPASKCFAGTIKVEKEIKIGLYEQEINPRYLKMTLNEAIEQILDEKKQPVSNQRVKQLLGDYLFNPMTDGQMPVAKLSGGQKARIQLIAMLADNPHILILDEPTNHLDLPSIEELENALQNYHGAVIYISHDSFFANKLGGQTIIIENPR